MVGPVSTSLVSGTSHADERLLHSFHDAYSLVVLGGRGAEVDASGGEHGLAQLAGEIGPVVGNNAAGRAVTRENVFGENVEHLF